MNDMLGTLLIEALKASRPDKAGKTKLSEEAQEQIKKIIIKDLGLPEGAAGIEIESEVGVRFSNGRASESKRLIGESADILDSYVQHAEKSNKECKEITELLFSSTYGLMRLDEAVFLGMRGTAAVKEILDLKKCAGCQTHAALSLAKLTKILIEGDERVIKPLCSCLSALIKEWQKENKRG